MRAARLEIPMAMSTKRNQTGRDEYLELVQKFPLKPVRNDAQLREAHKVIDELTRIPEEKLSRDQSDYLEVLGDLTHAFEERIMSAELATQTGLDVLSHLMDANAMSASDLGRMLGHRELGSKILRRERDISRSHATTLGEHFGLPAEIFLRRGESTIGGKNPKRNGARQAGTRAGTAAKRRKVG
jgi:HTH-type transcriptional regulator/antitoxin HigA